MNLKQSRRKSYYGKISREGNPVLGVLIERPLGRPPAGIGWRDLTACYDICCSTLNTIISTNNPAIGLEGPTAEVSGNIITDSAASASTAPITVDAFEFTSPLLNIEYDSEGNYTIEVVDDSVDFTITFTVTLHSENAESVNIPVTFTYTAA
jgi:hypothetical protein